MPEFSLLNLFAVLCGAGAILFFFFGGRVRYTYDAMNPYRRFCTKCRQQQVRICGGARNTCWWESVGIIRDQSCNCHHDTE